MPDYLDPALRITPQYFVEELIDIPKLTELLELYSNATKMVTALLDLHGNVLIATNWQDSCTKFHRKNEQTCANCLESDTALAGALAAGNKYNVYRCKNGLVDVATPVIIEGQHIANLFTGQFFFEPPNLEEFRQKARNVGFDEEQYLDAIQRVPVYSESEIEAHFAFLAKLAEMVAEMGANTIKIKQMNKKVIQEHDVLASSFSKFIEMAPIGVVKNRIDNGRFLLANDAFSRLVGTDKLSLMSQTLRELIAPADRESFDKAIVGLPKSKAFGDLNVHIQVAPNSYATVLLHGVLVEETTGVKSIWTVVQDITESMTLQANLIEAIDKANMASNAKSDFLANMSHEIRTPMNGVLGSLQLLENQVTEPQNKKLLDASLTSARSLLTIINDILDFSKLEAGKLKLESIGLSLSQIIETIISDIGPTAHKKNIKLYAHISTDSNDQWLGDPTRIRQILINVVSNAIKFTKQGEVTISLTTRVDNGQRLPVITITDTGIGMDEQGVKALFERFEQADTSTTRSFGGTGLGMSITRNLLTLMNGTIDIQSQLGKGTTVTIALPLEADSSTISQPKKVELFPAPDLSGKCILVAEDNDINWLIVSTMLKHTKATLVHAKDGQIAIEKFATVTPDIVLMDIHMPNMDGINACHHIKQHSPNTPVIVLTASIMSDDIAMYERVGFDDWLGKPLEMNLLYKKLSVFQ
ncbi:MULTISPECIES: PocR ligand-binding domain-containing protein [Pseudoalteromonas]|uniref:histidine kinase n=1 Tax=Pseudoalteromonas amylolytica TaxID=1859457 RepID=A0A1S1MSX5_9GAMM|nr:MULTISPECIES: PocR ligand-binding domain-containing protein [Pseudoalteromonas]OHU88445.1 hypothetical protein BFC16_07045 [Pseudoalteromonas sp. JW3]OHU90288.1 hypothetical protein BET10_12875 [Pseudoalteromonas amylolytica]